VKIGVNEDRSGRALADPAHGAGGLVGRSGVSEEERGWAAEDLYEAVAPLFPKSEQRLLREAVRHYIRNRECFVAQHLDCVSAGDLHVPTDGHEQVVTVACALGSLVELLRTYATAGRGDPASPLPLLDAMASMGQVAEMRTFVERLAEPRRVAVFGESQPPFASYDEATAWLERESKSSSLGSLPANAQSRLAREARRLGRLYPATKITVGFEEPCVRWASGGRTLYPATSAALRRLAEAQDDLVKSQVFDWSPAEATSYLLLGVAPLGLWRAWLEEPLYGHRDAGLMVYERVRLVFYTRHVSARDLRRVHGALRSRGVFRAKRVRRDSDAQADLFSFVFERRNEQRPWERPEAWEAIREQWNAGHGHRYASVDGLRRAYFAAREARGLPRRPERRRQGVLRRGAPGGAR